MRLTLRTLLAYSDDILDPADHEELGKKIEASDFATELIHRTRDTVRRLRLGAPEVLADSGDGVLDTICVSDANTVAEYLDNTMVPEDVADFERICLEPGNEADMHLAEVASCHHVLTMVLGEPAEIDAEVRKRMYELPTNLSAGQKLRAEPAHVRPQQVAAPPIVPPVAQESDQSEAEVPDYLREAARAKGRGKRAVMTAALLLVVGAVGYFAFSPVEQPSAPGGVEIGDLAGAEGDLEIGAGFDTEVGDVVGGTADAGGEAEPFVPGEIIEEPTVPLVEGIGPAIETPDVEDSIGSVVESASEMELPEAGSGNSETVVSASPPTTGPVLPESTEVVTQADEVEMAEGNATDVAADTQRVASVAGSSGDTLEAASGQSGQVQLGSYLGNNDVLLRRDGESNQWIRLPPRSAISLGDELLTLPAFRTHVVLADVNVYLSGGTQVVLPVEAEGSEDGDVELRLAVTYGKILLNAGLSGSRVAFYAGNDQREFQLSGSTSLAVEVRRVFVPGYDDESQAFPVEVVWYLTSGSVGWPEALGESQSIQAPATWKTVDSVDGLPLAIEELPEWIDREPMTDMQRRARTVLEEELALGEPVRLRLLELSDQGEKGRKREVRTLASEASVYIGEFEPFVKALGDKDQNRAWGTHIDTLRQALALSPDVAAGVREAFVSVRGEAAGGDLMEMVAGYNRDQIGRTPEATQEGAMVKLIRWLESDSLDYRVLAIYNMDGIIGTSSTKGFRPAAPPRQRRIAISKIRESFESGELLPGS